MAAISNPYTVKKGDTLSEIAQACKPDYYPDKNIYGKGGIVEILADLNEIENTNLIYVGQKLTIKSSTPTNKTTTKAQQAKIVHFGLLAGSGDRTVFATWAWSKSNVENYQITWKYITADGIELTGEDSTTNLKESVYTAPDYAVKVWFNVRPVSKTYKSGGKEVRYWQASWSTKVYYDFAKNPPNKPERVPVIVEPNADTELTKSTQDLKVELEYGSDSTEKPSPDYGNEFNAPAVMFEVVKEVDNSRVATGTVSAGKVETGSQDSTTAKLTFTFKAQPATSYKARCRSVKGNSYSDWTDWSNTVVSSPSASKGFTELRITNLENDKAWVYLRWYTISGVEKYEIQYTTTKRLFDTNPGSCTTVSTEDATAYLEILSGLDKGKEYFFRVRGVGKNSKYGPWSGIASLIVGEAPAAPTTWSLSTSASVGDDVYLYWVQNTSDGSKQTAANIKLITSDNPEGEIIPITTFPEDSDEASSYKLDTSKYTVGTSIKWRVQTAGIMKTEEGDPWFSDWSVERTIDIYAKPTLSLSIQGSNTNSDGELESFPIKLSADAWPLTQKPLSYHISIVANESYETVDNVGNPKFVRVGEEVYSKHFDADNNPLEIDISAGDVTLENNISYTIKGVVSMNSGMTAEATYPLTVAWEDGEYWPDAEISYDRETFTTIVRPYCADEYGRLIEDISLSIYRREFDGKFTLLHENIDNMNSEWIVDPHPALDFARYRVVAKNVNTGVTSYYDVPGYPIGETAVIIQWDETWSNFDVLADDPMAQPPWTGSLLRLPYNIDVTDDHAPDVELVEYIGRDHPVSYYGTQVGHTSSWQVEIEKADKETLHALRRLARWKGDVYAREPSGSGYWANITVSFSRKHLSMTIPVTLSVTRVEGDK